MDKLKVTKVDSVLIQSPEHPCRFATLHLTPHHLILTWDDPEGKSKGSTSSQHFQSLPSHPQRLPSSDQPGSSSSFSATHREEERKNNQREGELWIPYSLLSLVIRLPSLSPIKSKSTKAKALPPQDSTSFPPSNHQDNRLPSDSSKNSQRTLNNTPHHSHSSRIYPLAIKTRLFNSYSIGFTDENSAIDVFESIKNCRQITSINQLYAFFYNPNAISAPSSSSSFHQSASNPNLYQLYDFKQEFSRQGVGSRTKAWRYCDLNFNYDFSPTYPSTIIIPSRISDTTLRYGAKYRSKLRLPALSYLHWANLGSITRSSQPMVGLKQNRSIQDEKLIEAIFESHLYSDPNFGLNSVGAANALSNNGSNSSSASVPATIYGATTTNLIIDARPTTNAVANVAKGAGTENMDHYKGCKKVYLGVENIHVMRDSLNKVVEILLQNDQAATFGLGLRTGELELGTRTESTKSKVTNQNRLSTSDLLGLKKSNWLKHISSLLEGSLLITKNVHINSSHVLIHCSDGWDRTSQLSCISQILLDPYFRTMKGLSVLIEKDWCSFGHRFTDRCGHLGGVARFQIDSDSQNQSDDEEDDVENGNGQEEKRTRKEIETKEEENPGGFEQQAAQAFWGFTKQLQAGFQNVSNSNSKDPNSSSSSHMRETSPVFHQFLDCIWQIMEMFPNRFQFSELWLREILTKVYDCQYENFLFNNEKERKLGSCSNQTRSIWDEILLSQEEIHHNYERLRRSRAEIAANGSGEQGGNQETRSLESHKWLNPSYDPSLDDPKRSDTTDMGVLLPNPKQVKFWYQLFGREDSDINALIYSEEEERLRKKAEVLRIAEKEREKAENKRKEEEELAASDAAKKALREAQLLDDGSVGALGPTVEGSKDDPLIGANDNVPGSAPGTIRSGAVDLSTSRFDSNQLSYKPRNRPSVASRLSAVTSSAATTSPSKSSSSTSSLLSSPSSSISKSNLPPAPIISENPSHSNALSGSTNPPNQANPWSTSSADPSNDRTTSTANSFDSSSQDPWQAQQAAAAEAAQNMKKMFMGGWGRLTEAVNGVSSPPSSTSATIDTPNLPPSNSFDSSQTGSGFLSLKDAEPLKRRDLGNASPIRPALQQSQDSFDSISISSSMDRDPSEKLDGIQNNYSVVDHSKRNANLKKSAVVGDERNHWEDSTVTRTLDELTLGNEKKRGFDPDKYGYGQGQGGLEASLSRNAVSPSSDNPQIHPQAPSEVSVGSSKREEESKSASYDPLGVGL